MDALAVIGILAAVVGITAGIVQVLDYIQKRRVKRAPDRELQPPPVTTPSQVPGISGYQPDDVYSSYEAGLRQLLDRLGKSHPRYAEALVYQQRLSENIAEARRHGDTDTRQAERSEIIEQLNELSLAALNLSFSELCRQATPPVKPALPHNLPPRSEFIGREAEKARVHEALRSRSYLVSIDGIGGVGKTSLALEVAYECLRVTKERKLNGDTATFEGFIWTTAKDRDLTLNALLDAVARTLEYPGIAQQSLEEKQIGVQKLLQGKPYLLVVDNFETVTDEGVRDFLLKLPEPSKALITTREQKLRQAWAISLKGLAETEAFALIRNEGKRLGLPSLERAEDRVLSHLYQATGGTPLAIKWAVGQIKQKGQSLDTVLAALHEARGSIFDNVFARSWDLLSADARQVLVVMPIFATSASRSGIEAASDVYHFALDEALGQLVEMSLLDATDELDLNQRRYSIHPLTRAFAVAKLAQEPVIQDRAQRRLAQFISKFTEKHGGRWNLAGFRQLVPELPNILAVVQWCWRQQFVGLELHSLGSHIFNNIAYFLINQGYWNDLVDLGEQAVKLTIETEDKLSAGRLQVWPVAWIYRHQGDLRSAEKHIQQALAVFEEAGDDQGVASAKRELGRIAHKRGDLDEARRLLTDALDYYLSTPIQDERQVYLVTANLASVAAKRGDLDTAWELCNNILEPARRFGDPERIAHVVGILGEVSRGRGRLMEAKTFWEEALENMRRANRLDATADTLRYLALVEKEMGQVRIAGPRLLEALEIYRKLDMQSRTRELEELLAELSVATGSESRDDRRLAYAE
jgi:tetratricopeptide (TPR) repeat protein